MENVPEIIAAIAFFGLVFVCPMVYMMMRHQRAIAELIHGQGSEDLVRRVEALEHELADLRRAQLAHTTVSTTHLELTERVTETLKPTP